MNIKENKDFCSQIMSDELINEKLDDVTLKFINKPSSKSNGYVIPYIYDSRYKVVINLGKNSDATDENKKIYFYLTIMHELEHIKTFEKTKQSSFYSWEHLFSLLEYFTYLEEIKQTPNSYNANIIKKILLTKKMARNYSISTGEIKATFESYKKAEKIFSINKKILNSLDLLNNSMILIYDNNNLPLNKFEIFLVRSNDYLQKHPELIKKFKILSIIFNDDGSIKSIEELLKERNSFNYKIIDITILTLINRNTLINTEEFKSYLKELIINFNYKTIKFYDNIDLCKIFISDERILHDNLDLLIKKTRELNKLVDEFNLGVECKKIL